MAAAKGYKPCGSNFGWVLKAQSVMSPHGVHAHLTVNMTPKFKIDK